MRSYTVCAWPRPCIRTRSVREQGLQGRGVNVAFWVRRVQKGTVLSNMDEDEATDDSGFVKKRVDGREGIALYRV